MIGPHNEEEFAEVLSKLRDPFPEEDIQQFKQGGATLDYVPWTGYVLRMLNQAPSANVTIPFVTVAGEYLLVVVSVEVNGIVRQNGGIAPVGKSKQKGFGGAFPEAFSQALRRAFAMHGMGLELYYDEEERWIVSGEEPEDDEDDEPSLPEPTEAQIQRLAQYGEYLEQEGLTEEVEDFRARLADTFSKRTAGVIIREMKELVTDLGLEGPEEDENGSGPLEGDED